ncbi:MAG: hypothetical protein IT323_10010 [Anaerolineae bacterium]|nr:hypothetical protein [Anaerolineae bacterium]
MDYGMIGQIAKAKHYAEERSRIAFKRFTVTLEGNNSTHIVSYGDAGWQSDSSFFQQHGWSSHTIAMERILQGMIQPIQTNGNGKEPASNSSYISQLEKAKRYTSEPNRVRFQNFVATLAGENSDHTVSYNEGKWSCDCNFFRSHGWCSHTIAIERILAQMVAPGAPAKA